MSGAARRLYLMLLPVATLRQFLSAILQIPLLLFQAPLITKSNINIVKHFRFNLTPSQTIKDIQAVGDLLL